MPWNISAEGYPAHVHLNWINNVGSTYDVYRANKSGKFVHCAQVNGNEYMDFSIGKSDQSREYTYRICPTGYPVDSASVFEVKAQVPAACDSVLLDMVQKYTLKYFVDFAHPQTGLARERSNDLNGDIVTTGGTGFGLMAIIAGVERGFVPREKGLQIIEKTVTFLEKCEKFHGAWAHWYDGDTGKTFSFSKYDDGGDIVLFFGIYPEYFMGEPDYAVDYTPTVRLSLIYESDEEGEGTMICEDEAVIRKFAAKIPVSRFLVNTPAALGGIGSTTGLFPALTLGCGAVGGSSSSNNISPLDLINIRRVAWGIGASEPSRMQFDPALVDLLTRKILEKLG